MIDLNNNDLENIKNAVLGEFYCFDTVKSTNSEALNRPFAPDKSLFLAQNQTDGRGRMGKKWEASEGGIYMTVLLKPEKIGEDISALTLAIGLAVSRAIPNSRIKWPNDIILGDKKVAGILLETKIIGKSGMIAVGIGINANNADFSEELLGKATSISLFTGKIQNKSELIIRVYKEFLKVYSEFMRGFDRIKAEYVKRCITLNREITVIINSECRKMYAAGIGENGELLAEENGEIKTINFGEVSVRGILGYI